MTEKAKTTTAGKANTLAAALVAAQSEMPEIPKDGTATVRGVSKSGKPYEYEYKYGTLPTIFRMVLPVLHKHGIALTQTSGDGHLITTLRHESGECLSSSLEMPSPRSLSPQDWGKAHSYYRRYEVNGMLGISPDEDTNGAGVEAPPSPVQPPLAAPTPATAHATVAAQLIDNQHSLVEAWSVAKLETRGEALRAVGDYLDALEINGGDDLYTFAVRGMKSAVDSRNA